MQQERGLGPAGLAERLLDLKARSGRSYEQIARKTYLSKSNIHRVCAGRALPADFGAVEQIAHACGATRAELAVLYRLWEAETAARPAATPLDPVTDEVEDHADQTDATIWSSNAPPPDPPGARGSSPSRRPRRVLSAAVGATLIGLLLAVLVPAPGREGSAVPEQWISGPTWQLAEAPVEPTFFGVTIQSPTGSMPTFRVGAARLWDGGTRWQQIQPRRGVFDWTTMDRLVDGARRAGLPVMFVAGGTQGWASPAGRKSVYSDESRATPPDDLADWDAYITAIATRYRGKLESYELWVLGNDPRFFSGSVETLVDMTRRASRIIRKLDPHATLVCPGMGLLWTPQGQQIMKRFAELDGYSFCDVAGIKLYQRTASDPPETMLELTALVDRLFHEAGTHPPLWSTGTTYDVTLQERLPEDTARNYIVRFYLTGVIARQANLDRMYFYNWGGVKIPLVLQADGGAPTRAALALEQLQRWLTGARSRSCGQGVPAGLPLHGWMCSFTFDGGRRKVDIVWTDRGTAMVKARPGVQRVHHLDGTVRTTRVAEDVPIGETPVMVEYAAEPAPTDARGT